MTERTSEGSSLPERRFFLCGSDTDLNTFLKERRSDEEEAHIAPNHNLSLHDSKQICAVPLIITLFYSVGAHTHQFNVRNPRIEIFLCESGAHAAVAADLAFTRDGETSKAPAMTSIFLSLSLPLCFSLRVGHRGA